MNTERERKKKRREIKDRKYRKNKKAKKKGIIKKKKMQDARWSLLTALSHKRSLGLPLFTEYSKVIQVTC